MTAETKQSLSRVEILERLDKVREQVEHVVRKCKDWQRSASRTGVGANAHTLNKSLQQLVRRPLQKVIDELDAITRES